VKTNVAASNRVASSHTQVPTLQYSNAEGFGEPGIQKHLRQVPRRLSGSRRSIQKLIGVWSRRTLELLWEALVTAS
jgi:hypothetical protein